MFRLHDYAESIVSDCFHIWILLVCLLRNNTGLCIFHKAKFKTFKDLLKTIMNEI